MQFQVIKLYYSLMTQIYLYLTNHFMEWLLKQINVKNCSLSTTYNGEMTHQKQQK